MHVLDKFKLSRRHLLRGLIGGSAVAIGLPPLEAMMGRSRTAAAGGDLPKRFISFFFGNGVHHVLGHCDTAGYRGFGHGLIWWPTLHGGSCP